MQDDPFFSLDPYHITLVTVGAIVIFSHWLPRLVSTKEPVAAPLMILFGAAAAIFVPDLLAVPDPRQMPVPWEAISELTVIVALFGAGLRIDSLRPWRRWGSTVRMLVIAMPMTIVSVAFLGMALDGMTIAGAILLGAVLAPTDPVLASDVQVGPPHEGDEHPVRFTLTTEAGLNDGLAFPFVYLAMIVAAQGIGDVGTWIADWLWRDVVYRIVVGALMGWLGARALGYLIFGIPKGSPLAKTSSGVVAFAGVLLCYGSTELVEGYGFIAVAVLGLALRRIEETHLFHRRLHDASEAIEHALSAVLLVAIGMMLPVLMTDLSPAHLIIALLLILIVRPLSGWIALFRTDLSIGERAVVSIYGVRGIGSIYYLSYAGSHIEFENETQLWSLVALAVFLSTLLHGFSVGWALDRISRARA